MISVKLINFSSNVQDTLAMLDSQLVWYMVLEGVQMSTERQQMEDQSTAVENNLGNSVTTGKCYSYIEQ